MIAYKATEIRGYIPYNIIWDQQSKAFINQQNPHILLNSIFNENSSRGHGDENANVSQRSSFHPVSRSAMIVI